MVEFLVRKGADIHAQNNRGETPLHLASRQGHLSVVEFLVRSGADIRAQANNGDTPLDNSIQRRKQDVVDYLERMTNVHQRHSFVLYLLQESFFNKTNSEEE